MNSKRVCALLGADAAQYHHQLGMLTWQCRIPLQRFAAVIDRTSIHRLLLGSGPEPPADLQHKPSCLSAGTFHIEATSAQL